ncbi:hypothetical protein ACFLRN_02925 [Thermoproteota archaeon]
MSTIFVNLKLKYENFKKGNENPYAVRTEALRVLEETRENSDKNMIDEIEDMLLDIEYSLNENKCNCNRSSC